MQKEIKKRASVYGVVAILLAVVLSALCFNFGVIPEFGPPSQQPPTPHSTLLKTFSSEEELRSFLAANSKVQGAFPFYGPSDVGFLGPTVEGFDASAPSLRLYSTTNIQVAGVDEADIVKTDGEYIYVVSGNRNSGYVGVAPGLEGPVKPSTAPTPSFTSSVFILKAYPPEEAKIVSNLTFTDTCVVGIFVSGDRLAVLGSKYQVPSTSYCRSFTIDIKTFANIYDISDRAKPTFLTNFTISGSYFSSRMIGDYLYFVASQPAYVIYDTVVLPKIYSGIGMTEISPSEIYYFNASDEYYQYTTIVALNMQNATEEPNHMTVMLGGTSSMYVSASEMYITFRESIFTPSPVMDQQTSIYRIRVENSTISCEAKGKVPGRELNQFSMDEYNGFFRIATTTWVNGTSQSNLYVLDMNLSLVGSLEGIAPNETMDSARFIGNRCYLSTSVVRRDPFFVIDAENATEPKILGYLKIPGFTRYLHPYDEDHVIGIGKDGSNVKITLFDVSDVSAPINMTEYKIEGSWSDASVLTEPKAFLFDKSKDLLVIPVSVSLDDGSWWQGAYVFNITLSDGLVLKGNVTHQQDSAAGWDSNYWVKRALYIEDMLYTVSNKKVKMNSLEDLSPVNEIDFP
jgi:inhibitor of cysteine peptidase